jgi:hypothetical protein
LDHQAKSAGRTKRLLGNLLLSLATVGLMIGAIELVGHLLMRPSTKAFAAILGSDLPPFRVVPACDAEAPAPPPAVSAPKVIRVAAGGPTVAADRKPARSDYTGMYRDDPVLGYAPQENALSPLGWWQVNNLGARARHDAAAVPPAGEKRIVIFGESFGAGSRVRQEQTWSAIMARALPETEVLNFAVDGYGMGQAYLRFRELRQRIKYDAVIMMFLPGADLGRDINVYRPLLSWEWGVFTPMPRFVVEDGHLKLIPRSDEPRPRFMAENCHGATAKLRSYLSKYDRFYFDSRYGEGPPIVRHSVLYKLAARVYAHLQRRRLDAGLLRLHGEAFTVSRAIFRQMNADAQQDGGKFVLVVVPLESEIKRYRSNAVYRRRWTAMMASLCAKGIACIDLAPDLAAAPASQIDRGYDGTHYGPLTNRLIGQFVARQLIEQNTLVENARRPAEATP